MFPNAISYVRLRSFSIFSIYIPSLSHHSQVEQGIFRLVIQMTKSYAVAIYLIHHIVTQRLTFSAITSRDHFTISFTSQMILLLLMQKNKRLKTSTTLSCLSSFQIKRVFLNAHNKKKRQNLIVKVRPQKALSQN